jgi:hypothetical protein
LPKQIPHRLDVLGTEYVAMPDVVLFPAGASPLVPAYYLPEFVGKDSLTLSFQIISDIYLGTAGCVENGG